MNRMEMDRTHNKKALHDKQRLFSFRPGFPPVRLSYRKIKNINLYLRPPYQEILVTAPLHMPEQRVMRFLSEKESWIKRNLQRLKTGGKAQKNRLEEDCSPEERACMKDRLDRMLPAMLAQWEKRIGVHAESISYRKMRRCFGVCHTGKRSITFNLFLGEAPERLIEYIAVHELCHLLEPSHNARFHHLMDRFLPDWRERKREINRFYSG